MVPKVAFRTHFKPDMYPQRVNHEHDNDLTDYSISKPNYEHWSAATAVRQNLKGIGYEF